MNHFEFLSVQLPTIVQIMDNEGEERDKGVEGDLSS